jgi:hypothetical protein
MRQHTLTSAYVELRLRSHICKAKQELDMYEALSYVELDMYEALSYVDMYEALSYVELLLCCLRLC